MLVPERLPPNDGGIRSGRRRSPQRVAAVTARRPRRRRGADSLALLDEQVGNLSERVFELGRAADRQLFLWLTFAALTVLFGFGLTKRSTVGGIELDTDVATIVAYGLSCLVYVRYSLSTAALGLWREALKEQRELRYELLLQVAGQQGPEVFARPRAAKSGV